MSLRALAPYLAPARKALAVGDAKSLFKGTLCQSHRWPGEDRIDPAEAARRCPDGIGNTVYYTLRRAEQGKNFGFFPDYCLDRDWAL